MAIKQKLISMKQRINNEPKIKSIKIEYMYGASKFLLMNVVNKVTISNDEWKYLKNQ